MLIEAWFFLLKFPFLTVRHKNSLERFCITLPHSGWDPLSWYHFLGLIGWLYHQSITDWQHQLFMSLGKVNKMHLKYIFAIELLLERWIKIMELWIKGCNNINEKETLKDYWEFSLVGQDNDLYIRYLYMDSFPNFSD